MVATVATMEERLADFYAPGYRIRVGAVDLVADLGLEVANVQVEASLGTAARFSFVLNGVFDIEQRDFAYFLDFFEVGAPVQIDLGYRDLLVPMIDALITSVSTSFPSSGLPQITVSGYDRSYRMMRGKRSRSRGTNRSGTKHSEVVASVAGDYELNSRVQDTKVMHPKVEQNQESDFKFIQRLAELNGFECYVRLDELRFVPPANDLDENLTLEWGAGLISFSPEINVNQQIARVEVVGWDARTKKPIVGTAGRRDEPGRDRGRRSGAEVARDVFGKAPVLRVRRPVYSKAEADQRAASILKQRAERYVTGSGEAVGLPQLLPDTNVEIKGVGADLGRVYYVEQATHSLTASGYRTTFRVKETTV